MPPTRLQVAAALLVGALLAGSLAGCSKTRSEVKPPVAASVRNPRALFIGNAAGPISTGVALPSGVSAGVDERLLALGEGGTIEPVSFVDQDGNIVDVVMDEVVALSPEYVLLRIYYPTGKRPDVRFVMAQVVLRTADGKLLDLGGASIASWTAQLKGTNLYGLGGGVLFRIELASMRSVPMNNPSYDFIDLGAVLSDLIFAVDHDGNVRAPATVFPAPVEFARIFFADNRVPVADGWGSRSSYCEGLPAYRSPTPLAMVYGEDGHLYVVCDSFAQDPDVQTTWYTEYYVRDVSFGAAGRQFSDVRVRRAAAEGSATMPWDWEIPIAAAHTYGMNTRSRYLPRTTWSHTSSGFFTMTPVQGGGVSLTWTDKALPGIDLISGDYGYWRSGNSISRIKFDAGSTAETLVTDPNLIGWNVVGGVVLYTSYLTGTSVGTYRVSSPGATPELILTSDMRVRQIVEL